jgi:hypothetical protein
MADHLPAKLASVFRSLRHGRHVCREDGGEYRDLERNEDQYRALFQALGYKLVHHGQGFYYFEGRQSLSSQRLQAIVLFTLILFQDLEEHKFEEAERAWERALLSKIFKIAELPHFQTSQRRSLLHSVKVTSETLYDNVLKPMSRYGMSEMIGRDQFQLRSPIYRFLDLCLRVADDGNPLGAAVGNPNVDQTLPADDWLQSNSRNGE